MFLTKNDLPSLKAYFAKELPNFSKTELSSMWKQLMQKRFDWSDADFILKKEALFSESDLLFFRNVVKRLQKNEPFQYILGEIEFYGLSLTIDKRALIPRPETEELVNWIVSDYPLNEKHQIIDVCSGSGCIALALKSKFLNAEINAFEWSEEAISLIHDNIKRLKLEINVSKFDALNSAFYLSLEENSYDIWVSNPPYIPFSDQEFMKENVLAFEPRMALFVDNETPFVFYEVISKKAQLFLKEKGCLYFEIHEKYSKEIQQILQNNNFVNIEVRKDLQGRDRMIKAQKVSSQYGSERG